MSISHNGVVWPKIDLEWFGKEETRDFIFDLLHGFIEEEIFTEAQTRYLLEQQGMEDRLIDQIMVQIRMEKHFEGI